MSSRDYEESCYNLDSNFANHLVLIMKFHFLGEVGYLKKVTI